MPRRPPAGSRPCPPWCVAPHGTIPDHQTLVHTGGALMVRHTLLRLSTTIDPLGGTQDGPYVVVGAEEFTLHEAEALLAALTQLVDEGHRSVAAQQPEGALPVLDP